MYANGLGVTENRIEAIKWHRVAAENGNVTSMAALGGCYSSGRGVDICFPEAEKWLLKAASCGGAQQGDANVQYLLGTLYTDERFKVDYVTAAKWFLIAAEAGHPKAQKFLGQMYRQGDGVDKDESISVKWLMRAAKQGNCEVADESRFSIRAG